MHTQIMFSTSYFLMVIGNTLICFVHLSVVETIVTVLEADKKITLKSALEKLPLKKCNDFAC